MEIKPRYSSLSYFKITFPREHVAHVEINRPGKRNSFIRAMWLEIRQVFEMLSHDAQVRCIVLSGAGDQAFCSGLDVQEAMKGPLLNTASNGQTDGARKATILRHSITEFQSCINAIETCAKPVIVLLHGYCFGLALDIALAADIRLCSRYGRASESSSDPSPTPPSVPPTTQQLPSSPSISAPPPPPSSSSSSSSQTPSFPTLFSIKEVDIGLAADIGTLSRLPRAGVSMSWAKEVCLTARTFGAEEAARVGLVSLPPCKSSGTSSSGGTSRSRNRNEGGGGERNGLESNGNGNGNGESSAETVYLPMDKQSLLAEGLALASVIASKSPVATQGTKELLNVGRDRGVEESLRYTAVWNSAMLQTNDVTRSISAFMKGKKPTYENL